MQAVTCSHSAHRTYVPLYIDGSCLLQGIKGPEGLKATGSMDALVEHAEIFLMVVPTPFVAATVSALKDKFKPHQVSSHLNINVFLLGHSCPTGW